METRGSTDQMAVPPDDLAGRLYGVLLAILQAIMLVELVLLIRASQWLTALQVVIIMGLTLAPLALKARLPVRIPSEFQILAILFVFASLFLGEVRNYYELIWWWDACLHASSGLLFGIVGFLLVYVLNENERIDISLRPRFVALFAFTFAMAVGGLWEVFEFAMDQTFGLQMQKPRLDDPSGLTDTMWDLWFDAVGAVIISGFGWWYMVRDERSFIENWIRKFNAYNRRLFSRHSSRGIDGLGRDVRMSAGVREGSERL
jgi:hypothetical protein